ncbi:MAG: beta strand repeat-containing protein, partial [Thermoguttaceae bacterium]
CKAPGAPCTEAAGDGLRVINGGNNSITENLISGVRHAIHLQSSTYNDIQGNIVGLNAAGDAILGNSGLGIVLNGGSYNTVGGTTAAARNVVAGNTSYGLYVTNASYNTIQGNYIGTYADGTGALGVTGNQLGIRVAGSAVDNLIGGVDANAGNLIAYNSGVGVLIENASATGNSVLGNSIYENSGLGIDINGDGVTANDTLDPDLGANNLQNFPLLTEAVTNGTQLRISGTLNSTASTNFRIEFFANSAGDSSGYGQGQQFLGYANVTTDVTGDASFDTTFTVVVPEGYAISATATNLSTNDTSEFAQNVVASPPGIAIVPTSGLITDEEGVTAQFTVRLNIAPTSDVVILLASSDTTEGTVSTSSLTFTTSNWNEAQTITITGVDDAVQDGNIDYTIHLAVDDAHSATEFAGAVADVSATNIDDEGPGVRITPSTPLTTSEDGTQDNFSIVLRTQPTADVVVTLTPSVTGAGTLSASTLTFTSENWDQVQTVTVTGLDNFYIGQIDYTIDLSVASTDPDYSGVSAPSVTVTNLENDTFNTIYVDTNSDVNDGDTSSVEALYANKGADGKISLREAIIAANNTDNGVGGGDRIYFNIAGSGVHTISPTSELPTIGDAVVIDGYTQSGATENTLAIGDNANLLIQLDGSSAGSGADGLKLYPGSDGSTIRGLVINNYTSTGIKIYSTNNIIAGNFIGTDVTGTTALDNYEGILIYGHYNTIGGTNAADRNVISGNTHHGVYIGSADYNTIENNYIGLDSSGTTMLANEYMALRVNTGFYNTIKDNVLAADTNSRYILYLGGTASYNTIDGNYVGLNAAGTAAVAPPGWTGGDGIRTSSTTCESNTITNNVIAGTRYGIHVQGPSNVIQGNIIGLNAAGDTVIGNSASGIVLNGVAASYNIVGGTSVSERNVIAGNGGFGLYVNSSIYNTIQGNYIGTYADGTGALGVTGNAMSGVFIFAGNAHNLIGGTEPGAGNLIAYNGQNGVSVEKAGDTGNSILGNSIYGNGLIGIDLYHTTTTGHPRGDGVTANDIKDTDTAGGNNLQNFPDISTASSNGTLVSISGNLNSTPGATFRIEYFANSAADATGYGQGQRYLGYANLTTDGNGNAPFITNLDAVVQEGEYISATATNLATGDTSEFAYDVQAHRAGVTVTPIGSELVTNEDGATAQFTVRLSAAPTSDVIIGISSSNTDEGTLSASSLTFTPANWNVAQIVTVTGVMDYSTDGSTAYSIEMNAAESSDVIYQGITTSNLEVVNEDHVNTAPSLTVPGLQTAGFSLVFSSAAGNEIQLGDNDAGPHALQIQLIATNGTVSLGNTEGLTFTTGNGSSNSTLQFTGTVADLNTALEGMTFFPTSNNGKLQISVNDLGNSGVGGELISTAEVDIAVAAELAPSTPPPTLPQTAFSSNSNTTILSSKANPSLANDGDLMALFSELHPIVRAETPNDELFAKNAKMLINNPNLTPITSVDLSPANSSAYDHAQVAPLSSMIPKVNEEKLAVQSSVVEPQVFWQEFKVLADASEHLPWLSKISVGAAIGVGAGLSAGYMMLAFRLGALVTSSLVTFPVWQWIDPLPVFETGFSPNKGLKFGQEGRQNDGQLDESLETILS